MTRNIFIKKNLRLEMDLQAWR